MGILGITTTPFAIGGNTRPPSGPQGIALTQFDGANYRLFLRGNMDGGGGGFDDFKIGAGHATTDGVTMLYLSMGAYLAGESCDIVVGLNANAGFPPSGAGGVVSMVVTALQSDGLTPVNVFSPVNDPLSVNNHVQDVELTVALSQANPTVVTSNTPGDVGFTTTTGAKYSLKFNLACQAIPTLQPYMFLPDIMALPDSQLILIFEITQYDNVGRGGISNYSMVLQMI